MIRPRIKAENPNANLKSYYKTYHSFEWTKVEAEISKNTAGYINIVQDAIDKWAENPKTQNKKALIFERDGTATDFSYLSLKELSCSWANLLSKYGFKTGDRIFIFLPPCPEIYIAMLACARIGAIASVLYSTLRRNELLWRIMNAEPRGIITHPTLEERLPSETSGMVKHVLLTEGPKPGVFRCEVDLPAVVAHMPKDFQNKCLPPETPLYMLYTSGSTGPSKGVIHAHESISGHLMTARYVLDLRKDSILWTDADPAWVTGTVYGAFAPWLCGATSLVQGDPYSASTWYKTLEKYSVTNWYTTPRTIRRLMEAGDDLPRRYDLSHLRHIATVGEKLGPSLFYWVKENLKHSPHDTWWMTETGMICIANFPSQPIKPGSMGKPVPGIEASVVDAKGNPLPPLTLGELALKPGWPSMMKAIWKDKERYKGYFRNGWFLTGDIVIKDEEGYYYYHGRNDDLIKLGKGFVGPYDLEQILCTHPAVTEATVISKSLGADEMGMKAFVKLNRRFIPSRRLNNEICDFVKNNFSSDLLTFEIDFVNDLPKTLSGKLLRRVLRAWDFGLPSGDLTSLKE